MRPLILLPMLGLMACDPTPMAPETDLPFFGDDDD